MDDRRAISTRTTVSIGPRGVGSTAVDERGTHGSFRTAAAADTLRSKSHQRRRIDRCSAQHRLLYSRT
jgi:hypothetical protein